MSKQLLVLTVIALLIVGGGILLYINEDPPEPSGEFVFDPNQTPELIREHSYTSGNPEAKVTLVEFGDMQCPACAAAFPNVRQILAEYGDEIRFVFRYFPLIKTHPNAEIAAQAMEAARTQGKFQELEEILFTRQNQWSKGNPSNILADYAAELGLDVDRFRQDIETNKYRDLVRQDLQDGMALGVNATPTFIINGKLHPGGGSITEFRQLIDAALTAN